MSEPAKECTQPLDAEVRLLAAITYGEASTKDDADEMFALASVLVRQKDARGYTSVASFAAKEKTFAYAAIDGNVRFQKLMKASEQEIAQQAGLRTAVAAAVNAINGGEDKSHGAYFWDGADIKTNYTRHFKVRRGIKFTDLAHNIYTIKESKKLIILSKTTKTRNRNTGQISSTTEEIGRFDHQYDSTAAYGGTIFWKLNPEFLMVTRGREYK
ncbi:UNVERIFIED_ORG: hypothetical protein JN05_01708 [Zoogloea ramigera]|uniref:Uncharacterized protein n=1 Tax=Duganella zoogloeoides TaxID=75659 RepID=A0ABZ0Y2M2_9BURK|nr:hypothetical protein [Duganella zoogloeoides]WQH05973.1 hypothetical protein SR858_06460 [Duganella zoogloeoides]